MLGCNSQAQDLRSHGGCRIIGPNVLQFQQSSIDISWTFKLIEISKEENEHDVIEEMEDRCCGSPGL